jgi:hypothetical protein
MWTIWHKLWPEPDDRPATILAAHQHIANLEHTKLGSIFHGDLNDACACLEWLTQLQANMHIALKSFVQQHPGGRTPIPPLNLGLASGDPRPRAVDAFGPSGLPILVMALVTTASLCLYRHEAPIRLHDQSEVVKASSPAHDILALRKLQQDHGDLVNIHASLASTLKQFCWYLTFFGLYFRTVTETDLSKSMCCLFLPLD